ncbi:MAG: hypothetical protein IJO60_05735 [Agathobacter sp.]|nr:hypothetical protein [Agathobacter sp.]
MKKRIAIMIIGLTVVLSIVACGNKNSLAEATETNSIVEDSEAIDTEVVATESVETTEVAENETEVSDEVAEILATYRKQGYALITAQDIENIIAGGYDPTNPAYIEDLEITKYGDTLDFEGRTGTHNFKLWAQSLGADTTMGWTFLYYNGEAAGDQPSYGVYMNESSPLYGMVYKVGDYLPNGQQFCGTLEEYGQWQTEQAIKEAKEEGNHYIDEETGRDVIIID